MQIADFTRIASDPAVCGGRPTIVSTRVRVSDVLAMLAGGASPDEITGDFPYITDADIRACLAFAAQSTDHPIVSAAA